MSADSHHDADREGHGEASLGEAQSSNPPSAPEMIRDEAEPAEAAEDEES